MKLVIVGLPLGNIEDISIRVVKTLDKASVIVCEDTRFFHKLWQKLMNMEVLNHKFTGKLMVLNDFNEKHEVERVVMKDEVILVSDAGMPTISDPGFRLVSRVIEMGGQIACVPGPTAMTTALALSGFSADKVLFLGFLARKLGKRREIWEWLKTTTGVTVVIYESPRRVERLLLEIRETFGDVETCIARELTKEHEEVVIDKASEVVAKLRSIKGEMVILFRKKDPQ